MSNETNINNLRKAIQTLSPSINVLANKIGIVGHTPAELTADPLQYLTIGALSIEHWPFNPTSDEIGVCHVIYAPGNPLEKIEGNLKSLIKLQSIREVWSIDENNLPLEKLYVRS